MSYIPREISIEDVKKEVKKQVYVQLKACYIRLSRQKFAEKYINNEGVQFMIRDLNKRFPKKELSNVFVMKEIDYYSSIIVDSIEKTMDYRVVFG